MRFSLERFMIRAMLPRLVCFALLSAVVLGAPGRASAADDAKRRAAFRQGIAAMQAEKWEDALGIYRKLWDDEHSYDVALSLGQAELNLKKYRDAAEHLEYGVRNIPPREDAAFSTRARRMLDVAKQEVGAIEIHVDRANADVLVDGTSIGTSPLPAVVFVEPGSHLIEAQASGSTPVRQMVNAVAGHESTLNLAFGEPSPAAPPSETHDDKPAVTPAPPPPAPDASPPANDSAGDGSTMRTVVLIGGIAVTTVAAAVTVSFALAGSSASSDADDARARATLHYGPTPCATAAGAASPECADLQNALDRRESNDRAANVALIVAAFAGVATATAFVVWPKDHHHDEHALRWAPVVGRGSGGLLVAGSF